MKVALMGQNGAGKSTLFKLITRKYTPISGEISLDKRLVVATAEQVIIKYGTHGRKLLSKISRER